jgi:hypothetical protein
MTEKNPIARKRMNRKHNEKKRNICKSINDQLLSGIWSIFFVVHATISNVSSFDFRCRQSRFLDIVCILQTGTKGCLRYAMH